MSKFSLTHLNDHALLRGLQSLLIQHRSTTAALLAHISEFDMRRLYLPAGCPSMFEYCVRQLRTSEDEACRRIRVARAAREFPEILVAIAEGRVHLTGLSLLAPRLTAANTGELLAAAAYKTKSEIEQVLADRFPQPDLATRVRVVPQATGELSVPERMDVPAIDGPFGVTERMSVPAAQPLPVADPKPRVTPLAPRRFALQITMSQELHDKLRYAQELLGHQVAPGDVAAVLERALDGLISRLEKRKFAATDRPRVVKQAPQDPRGIPSQVKRIVWKRDGGQCTFVAAGGDRCAARIGLEFDHIEPVARGGRSTIHNLRLRCRAHNQYEAELAFGVEFMRRKRNAAQARSASLGS